MRGGGRGRGSAGSGRQTHVEVVRRRSSMCLRDSSRTAAGRGCRARAAVRGSSAGEGYRSLVCRRLAAVMRWYHTLLSTRYAVQSRSGSAREHVPGPPSAEDGAESGGVYKRSPVFRARETERHVPIRHTLHHRRTAQRLEERIFERRKGRKDAVQSIIHSDSISTSVSVYLSIYTGLILSNNIPSPTPSHLKPTTHRKIK